MFFTLTICITCLLVLSKRSYRYRYIITVFHMIIFAVIETGITLWQPILIGPIPEWRPYIAILTTFPLEIYIGPSGIIIGSIYRLLIKIQIGPITLFNLESPTVFCCGATWKFWDNMLRLAALPTVLAFNILIGVVCLLFEGSVRALNNFRQSRLTKKQFQNTPGGSS